MVEHEIVVRLRLSRRALVWGAAALLLCCAANEVVSESLTMTTYYPAPSGTYQRLTTTGNAVLARDGGKVGIGTPAPQAALDIQSTSSGFLPPRLTTAQRNAIPAPPIGSMLFNTTSQQVEVWTGSWQAVGGVASGVLGGYCDRFTGRATYPATACLRIPNGDGHYFYISACAQGWTANIQTAQNPGSVTYTSYATCMKN